MNKFKNLLDNIIYNSPESEYLKIINVMSVSCAKLSEKKTELFFPVLKIVRLFCIKNKSKYNINDLFISDLEDLIKKLEEKVAKK